MGSTSKTRLIGAAQVRRARRRKGSSSVTAGTMATPASGRLSPSGSTAPGSGALAQDVADLGEQLLFLAGSGRRRRRFFFLLAQPVEVLHQ